MARTVSDDRILEAALDIIAQHGYAGATDTTDCRSGWH
jgi:AcrR family transcriptional regulator